MWDKIMKKRIGIILSSIILSVPRPSPGGASDNSPAIHCWVRSRLSLTPRFSWVLAESGMPSTVSTVSLLAPVSQRDYDIQPRVGRGAAFISVVQFLGAPRLPWVSSQGDPATLKGLRPLAEFSTQFHNVQLFTLRICSLETDPRGPFQRLGIDAFKGVGGKIPHPRIGV